MAQGTKKKSRLWSLKEIKKIAEIVESAIASGKSKMAGMDEAAAHFGVTRNAIHIRYSRYKKGESMTRVKRNTAKEPTKGKLRGPYKKRKYTKRKTAVTNPVVKDSNKLVFPIGLLTAHAPKIKELIVDFDARSVTYTF